MADRTRIFFDNTSSAAAGLIEVLQYARDNKEDSFRFGPRTAAGILDSGLWIEGQIDGVATMVENKILGSTRHDE